MGPCRTPALIGYSWEDFPTRTGPKPSVTNSAANKYYFSAGHHEQENQKTTGQIKFSAVTIKQRIKLVLRLLFVNKYQCIGSNAAAVLSAVFPA